MGKGIDGKGAFRRSSLRRKLLLVVGSIVCALWAVEGALRVLGVRPPTLNALTMFFEPDPAGWRGIPGASGWFTSTSFDAYVSHDKDGFRVCGLEQRIDADAGFDGEVVWCVGTRRPGGGACRTARPTSTT